jgi:hypothetical protein
MDPAGSALRVAYNGEIYLAAEVARGAAYELFSEEPQDGFRRTSSGPAGLSWHRFVHASDIGGVYGPVPEHADPTLDVPLQVPLSRARNWSDVHRMTQSPAGGDYAVVGAIRRSAAIRRGTRMIKVLSARQVAGHLRGWLPYGFCYREYDVAHLRTPEELRLLRADGPAGGEPDVAFALRWRAIDPYDYAVPHAGNHGGLLAMPPHDRVGSAVLGTGFTPSEHHVIPEFITADVADLPLTANAALVAYAPDGTEVVLYTYQPEQRGWIRMVGPQWRHLLAGVPGVAPDQDYVQLAQPSTSVRLIGWLRGQEYEAVADPPAEFRILAMTRAARYPVEALIRRTAYAAWRGALCTVLREESGWLRLRLCRPDADNVAALGAQCYERGVYEVWAPAGEVTDRRFIDIQYKLPT